VADMRLDEGTSRSTALDVANVGLIYQGSAGDVEALQSISFSAREGEFVSILGPSGCGKSSLLKLVLGLETATSGQLSISGRRLEGPTKDVGCVFQSPVLLPWRSILDNVLLPVDVMKLDRESVRARAESLLEMVGLKGFEGRYPYELSGGMQQRASIVRALVHDPRILLMDEPFAALDALTREQMAMELQRIWMKSRKTLLFITHAIGEAVILSDRIAVMSARPGRIIRIVENEAPRPRQFSDLGGAYLNGLMDEIRECLNPPKREHQ
jgi:NitT/TauT family transport system ATP-binding protein